MRAQKLLLPVSKSINQFFFIFFFVLAANFTYALCSISCCVTDQKRITSWARIIGSRVESSNHEVLWKASQWKASERRPLTVFICSTRMECQRTAWLPPQTFSTSKHIRSVATKKRKRSAAQIFKGKRVGGGQSAGSPAVLAHTHTHTHTYTHLSSFCNPKLHTRTLTLTQLPGKTGGQWLPVSWDLSW